MKYTSNDGNLDNMFNMGLPVPGCLTRENAFIKLPKINLGALIQTPISEDIEDSSGHTVDET